MDKTNIILEIILTIFKFITRSKKRKNREDQEGPRKAA